MYKLDLDKDHNAMIFFRNAFSVVPAIGPDSDMDGHDLSSLTRSETLRAEEFVERFNEYCADKARRTNFRGIPAIIVDMDFPEELE